MGQPTGRPAQAAPAHRVCVTDLSGVDAFAARGCGEPGEHVCDALVHVNQDLPEWAQLAAAGELLRRLADADDDAWASTRLPAGEALSVPRQRGTRSLRL
jgi:hypothetical protein